jgi:hypothetical protein
MGEPGWIGKVLVNRYRLDSLLGEGGMSSVYIDCRTDGTFSSGEIGLFVRTEVGSPAEVRFQNLVATALR